MRARTIGLALSTALAVALPLVVAETATGSVATASAETKAAADELCEPAPASAARTTAAGLRDHPDHPGVSEADRQALDPMSSREMRQAARALPSRVTIPVHVTIARGSHGRDRTVPVRATRKYVERLNKAFAGSQSSLGPGTRYRFTLSSVRVVRNDRWYHAVGNSRADREMRRKMHRGGAHSLNLYLTRPSRADINGYILGFARFPWLYKSPNRGLDGVTISVEALPGGRARGYNAGDTLVHEVGHWMGLFHTFEGGCSTRNDHVTDTAKEAEPSFECQITRDTCRGDGLADPVQNFMDYSYDSCMNHFTPGQVARMDLAWAKYRAKDR